MALVPFRVSGAAADQDAETRLLQVAGFTLSVVQYPRRSGNLSHLMNQQGIVWADSNDDDHPGKARGSGSSSSPRKGPDLSQVGQVVWESSWLLAELLLRLNPLGSWAGVQVLELGAGTGVTGMFLARAGAQVVLTDQPHILPLLKYNVLHNFLPNNQQPGSPMAMGTAAAAVAEDHTPNSNSNSSSCCPSPSDDQHMQERWGVPVVRPYVWGTPGDQLWSSLRPHLHPGSLTATGALPFQGPAVAAGYMPVGAPLLKHPAAATAAAASTGAADSLWASAAGHPAGDFDVIVGADLLYAPKAHTALLDSLEALAAPHTQVYLCHRLRGLGEEEFAAAAASRGWVVQTAPVSLLHEEYQSGQYEVLLLCRGGQ